ncbi:hypothetical protein N9043_00775 [bacterium]|nr:hypothetical protein [bacterium]
MENLIILRDRIIENIDNLGLGFNDELLVFSSKFIPMTEDEISDVQECEKIEHHLLFLTDDLKLLESRADQAWYSYVSRVFALEDWKIDRASFLCSPDWPDDTKETIGRINYLIANGNQPKYWNYNMSFS